MGKRTGKPRGRPQGAKNQRTVEREQQLAETSAKITEALGDEAFNGDAHELLIATYKNTSLTLDTRIDAAKAALPYEKPRLASMEANVNLSTHEETLEALAASEG